MFDPLSQLAGAEGLLAREANVGPFPSDAEIGGKPVTLAAQALVTATH